MTETNILRVIVFGVVAFYLVMSWFEKKMVKDERTTQIHLRATEITQKFSSFVVAGFGLAYLWFPKMDVIFLIVAIVACWLVSYPLGKIYLDKKM